MSRWAGSLPPQSELLSFAEKCADAAREIIGPRYRRGVPVDYKSDASPVTEADRAVEARIRELVAEVYPSHGVIGEEYGADERPGEPCWIIDPIDGTKAFVTGRPLFGTLLGLLVDKEPVMGVLDAPAMGERWVGANGMATKFNGEEVHGCARARLSDANLSSTSPDMFDATERPRFESLSRSCRFRVFGGDCYAYGLVASGHVDIVVEASMNAYDYLPLVPIVNGAGGVMTDWDGTPLSLTSSSGRVLAAGNDSLHRACVEILNR